MIDGNQPHMRSTERDYSAALDRQRRIDAAMPAMQAVAIEALAPHLIKAVKQELDYWGITAKEGEISKVLWGPGIEMAIKQVVSDIIHDRLPSWDSMEDEA